MHKEPTLLAALTAAAALAQPAAAQFVKQTNLVSDLSSMSPDRRSAIGEPLGRFA